MRHCICRSERLLDLPLALTLHQNASWQLWSGCARLWLHREGRLTSDLAPSQKQRLSATWHQFTNFFQRCRLPRIWACSSTVRAGDS